MTMGIRNLQGLRNNQKEIGIKAICINIYCIRILCKGHETETLAVQLSNYLNLKVKQFNTWRARLYILLLLNLFAYLLLRV